MKYFIIINSFERVSPLCLKVSFGSNFYFCILSSDRVNVYMLLKSQIAFRYKSYIPKQILYFCFSYFSSVTFCNFFFVLLVTVKWDKCIPVLNSYPTRSFPMGFFAGVLSPKGSRVLCFSVSCSQTVLCVLILVET